MDAKRVGTPKNRVGRYRSRTWNTASAVGRPEYRTASAPTRIGKYMLLPRPYAKNNFAAEKVRSRSVMPSTCNPEVSEHTTMSCWRWTAPLGNPVDPEANSQNATSSFVAPAASRLLAALDTHD